MSDYSLVRTKHVACDPAAVFACLDDLRRWDAWSPWAKLDPDAAMTYSEPPSGVDAFMDWEGNNKMGAGRMTVLERVPDTCLRYRLEFRRPMADRAEAQFDLQAAGGGTEVAWTMSGQQNLLQKLMWVLFVKRMLTAQFDAGLASLKRFAEGA